MNHDASEFTALGHRVEGTLSDLDRFPRPDTVDRVVMTSDEVTAVCPVTGQPDFYRVEIDYVPSQWCIESKSLKLYLQSFRDQGAFCEELAAIILGKVRDAIEPVSCVVTLDQKARGGITIRATARYPRDGA